MEGAAVDRIAELAEKAARSGPIVKLDGKEYSLEALHDPRKPEPEPKPLKVATLDSFVEFVKSTHDAGYRGSRGQFVHVADPTTVRLHTGIFGEHHQRVALAEACAVVPPIAFGQFLDPEEFIIQLLVNFEQTGDRDAVQRLLSNLGNEAVRTHDDDGLSQSVTMKLGTVRRGTEVVKNPFSLTPFRSFGEVEQTPSPFLLRMRGGGPETPPRCALFECDGGRWRLYAIANVKSCLAARLGDACAVYG
jgi:hypothetical protein